MTPHTSLSALDPHSPVRLFPDDEFRIVNATDASKQLAFDLSAIATSTTRTVTMPDASGTMALLERAQTFTKLATFALGLTVAGAAFASRGIQDDATARVLTLSGSGANSITIANSATSPILGTTAGALLVSPAGIATALFSPAASVGNYFDITGAINGGNPVIFARGVSDADVQFSIASKGAGNVAFLTNGGATLQAHVAHTAGANRYLTLTGSNGGAPTIGTSAGALTLAPAGANIILSGSATMLQANYGAFSGGEWSRDANWGTYYKAPAVGGVADIGLHSNDGFSSIRIGGTAAPGTVRFFTGTSAATENGRVFADGSWSLGLAAAPILTLSPDAVQATQRRIIITAGAAAGNPTIGTSGGNLAISSTVVGAGDFQARAATATPAGGMAAIYMGTNGYSIGFGSGAPTYIASKGSLYLRSDGSTTNNRMYVATDSAGNWTAVTTAA